MDIEKITCTIAHGQGYKNIINLQFVIWQLMSDSLEIINMDEPDYDRYKDQLEEELQVLRQRTKVPNAANVHI